MSGRSCSRSRSSRGCLQYSSDREASRFALLLPIPIMILWANVHGGWIVGAGTLMVWAAAGLISNSSAKDKLTLVAIAVVAVAATIFNPYGWHLWAFLWETVGFSRPDIVEWQPVFRLDFIYVALWGLVSLALAMALWRGAANRSLDLQALAMPLMLAVASLRVSRLQGFFAISVVMLMGSQLRSVQKPAAIQFTAPRAAPWPRIAVVVVLALAIISASLKAASENVGCVRMDSDKLPEPSITDVIAERALRGRMLTWFSWGEYAIWHWGREGILVSMDGRRETVYSNAAVAEHLKFYFQPDARHALIEKLQPDYIWLPSHLKVIEGLKKDGWRPIYSGDRSVLLARLRAERATAGQATAMFARDDSLTWRTLLCAVSRALASRCRLAASKATSYQARAVLLRILKLRQKPLELVVDEI